jgi:hypothetical protein
LTWESPELRGELDRVGVSYAKAGAGHLIWASEFGDFVSLSTRLESIPADHGEDRKYSCSACSRPYRTTRHDAAWSALG